jgi:hypothetical protein
LISGGVPHEPLHAGFVGYGMLDAAVPAGYSTSPTRIRMLAAAHAADTGAGALFVVKNYSGDVMNFEMAAEMYDARNAMVLVTTTSPSRIQSHDRKTRRRRDRHRGKDCRKPRRDRRESRAVQALGNWIIDPRRRWALRLQLHCAAAGNHHVSRRGRRNGSRRRHSRRAWTTPGEGRFGGRDLQ